MHHHLNFIELFSEISDVEFGHSNFILMIVVLNALKRRTDEGQLACWILTFEEIIFSVIWTVNFFGNVFEDVAIFFSRLHFNNHNL